MTDPNPSNPAAQAYRDRIQELERERSVLQNRFTLLARWRVATFLAAAAPLLLIETSPASWRWPLVGLGAGLLLAFAVLVARHRRLRQLLEEQDDRIAFSRHGLARISREWGGVPEPPSPAMDPEHPYAVDLDVTGRSSILHLLSTVVSRPGRSALTRWLLHPSEPEEISPRQEAVKDLAPRTQLREDLWTRARSLKGERKEGDLDAFIAWSEADSRGSILSPARLWSARILPVGTIVLLSLHLGGVVPAPAWILTILGVLAVERGVREGIDETFDAAEGAEGSVRAYASLLARMGAEEVEAERLREIRSRMLHGPADRALNDLRKILDLAAVRYSGLSHAPLRLLLAWDLHVIHRLERWRHAHGSGVRGWVEGMAEYEALCALGALAHDHPDWTYPELVESRDRDERRLEAEDLGHPLLPPRTCVRNDVTLGPPGTFLLVTGSNMSGKSTLLRAIGLNAVLARVGAPVCAGKLRMPALDVATSMRVQDSLSAGVSLFMAELNRLRAVVDRARAGDGEDRRPLVYLLDEILQGTNTAERRVAARTILRHLLATGSIGAVTTHDLTLASAPDLEERGTPVHFRETIQETEDGSTLHFDYTLRPGLATTRNALQLMKLVGLDPPDGT